MPTRMLSEPICHSLRVCGTDATHLGNAARVPVAVFALVDAVVRRGGETKKFELLRLDRPMPARQVGVKIASALQKALGSTPPDDVAVRVVWI